MISRLRFRSWLGLVVAAGTALRAWPLLGSEGHWGWPVFYDEGVYTAAALLFFQGAQPYRDFLLAHPPGVVYVLQPAAALAALTDPSLGFAVARWMAVGAGAANIALTGLLARAATGSVMGGLVGALLYAVHPEAMHAERGPNLEPLVTLPCLAAALLRSSASARRTTTSGVLLGLALSIKTWAVLWWVACLVGAPDEQQQRSSAVRVLATALVSVSVLVLPLALLAPAEFWEDVVQFHATRPPDGVLESYRRPIYMAAHGRTLAALLAFAGFGLAAARWRARSLSPAQRLVATAYGLTFAAFLASPTYWPHYNAFLAAPECVLAASALWGLVDGAPRWRCVLAASLVVGHVVYTHSRWMAVAADERPGPAMVRAVRASVPGDAGLFAFEPGWPLAAGRWPRPFCGPAVIDPLARMQLDAVASGRRFATADEAMETPEGQAVLIRAMERCDYVLIGAGSAVSPESRRLLEARYVRVAPADGRQRSAGLWRRR